MPSRTRTRWWRADLIAACIPWRIWIHCGSGKQSAWLARVLLIMFQTPKPDCLRDAGVADQHVSQTVVCDRRARAPSGQRRRTRARRAGPDCTPAADPPRRAAPRVGCPRGSSLGAAPRSRRCRRTTHRSRGRSHGSATASTETIRTRLGQRRWRSETPWTSARMRCTSLGP